jgi:hypothetical protein
VDNSIETGEVEPMVRFYEEKKMLLVNARKAAKAEWLFLPDRRGERLAIGSVSVFWRIGKRLSEGDDKRHLDLCTKLAKRLQSPYVKACEEGDLQQKTRRIVVRDASLLAPNAPPGTMVKQEVPKVRRYREGLDALFWRNFFGPEYVEMFGEILRSLPREVARDLGEGYWLVQPYREPSEAFTDEGRAREQETIAHLGSECFYDDVRERAPVRVPDFREEVGPLPPLVGFEDAH